MDCVYGYQRSCSRFHQIAIVISCCLAFATLATAASIMTFLFVEYQLATNKKGSEITPVDSYNPPSPNWVDDDDYDESGFHPPNFPPYSPPNPPPDPFPDSFPPNWIDNNFDSGNFNNPNFNVPDHFRRRNIFSSRSEPGNTLRDYEQETVNVLNAAYPALLWCGVILLIIALAMAIVLACVEERDRASQGRDSGAQHEPYPTQQPQPGMPSPKGQMYSYGPDPGQQGYYPGPHPQHYQRQPGQEHSPYPNQYANNQSQTPYPQGPPVDQMAKSESQEENSIDKSTNSENPKLYRVPSQSEDKENKEGKEERKESMGFIKRTTLDSGESGRYGPVTPPVELNETADEVDQKQSKGSVAFTQKTTNDGTATESRRSKVKAKRSIVDGRKSSKAPTTQHVIGSEQDSANKES